MSYRRPLLTLAARNALEDRNNFSFLLIPKVSPTTSTLHFIRPASMVCRFLGLSGLSTPGYAHIRHTICSSSSVIRSSSRRVAAARHGRERDVSLFPQDRILRLSDVRARRRHETSTSPSQTSALPKRSRACGARSRRFAYARERKVLRVQTDAPVGRLLRSYVLLNIKAGTLHGWVLVRNATFVEEFTVQPRD